MMQDSKTVHMQTVRTPNKRKRAYKMKIAHMAYSVIGGSILLLAGIPPIPANAEPAPRCVEVSSNPSPPGPLKTILVTNLCRANKTVFVILSGGQRTTCDTYVPWQKGIFRFPEGTRIVSVERC
jgi:hypothetical protein